MDYTKEEREKIYKRRLSASAHSKLTVNQKCTAIRKLMEIAEDKISEGDSWRATYRLPELFGASQRKKSHLLENLPEAVFEAENNDPYNMAVAAKKTVEHFDNLSMYRIILSEVIEDSVDYGTGILLNSVTKVDRSITPADKPKLFLPKSKNPRMATLYYGLAPQRIDIRDFFPDPSATVDHDHTGEKGMGWCFIRAIYSEEGFLSKFKNVEGFNLGDVTPVSWSAIEDQYQREKTKHESEEKEVNGVDKYYVVYEGWDVRNDWHCFVANDKEIYFGALPYKHKMLPITLYYNYKRADSIWGISEAEIQAGFIFIKENLINLMIDNAKLQGQGVTAVSGDCNFDPDENQIEPGGFIELAGLSGGKLQDNVMQLNFASNVEPIEFVKRVVEDLQIQVTGDDTRALFAEPNELATQTLAKRESLMRRIRLNVKMNTDRSEYYSLQQRLYNIVQFLAMPYQDVDGQTRYHSIYADGFFVAQRNPKQRPEFVSQHGFPGRFFLNEATIEPKLLTFKVVSRVEDAVKKEQQIQSMQLYTDSVFKLAQAQPTLIEGADLLMLAKETGRKLDLDVEAIFNPASKVKDGLTEHDYMIRQIILGAMPKINRDGNNIRRLEKMRLFGKTKEYDQLNKKAKQVYARTIGEITSAIREEATLSWDDFTSIKRSRASREAGEPGAVPMSSGAGGVQMGAVPETATQ